MTPEEFKMLCQISKPISIDDIDLCEYGFTIKFENGVSVFLILHYDAAPYIEFKKV